MRFIYIALMLFISHLSFSQTTEKEKWRHFIQLDKELRANTNKDTLLNCLISFKVLETLKENSYAVKRKLDEEYAIVSISLNLLNALKKSNIRIWEANDLWKLNENMNSCPEDEIQNFLIKVKSQNEFEQFIKSNSGIKTLDTRKNIYIIQAKLKDIKSHGIIASENVQYIGIESLIPKQESKIAEMDLSVNQINQVHHLFPLLTGKGQTISIKDNAFNTKDIDLVDKYISSSLVSPIIDAHATAMATIAAGSGNTSSKGKGVAFECQLTSSDYSDIFPDLPGQLAALNVSIQNHSYGTEIENFYGAIAEAYDEICYSNPNLLHVFSSGNSGEVVPEDGIYKGLGNYANLTGNFKMSKNTLCVGSVGYNDEIMNFSSKGPAFDGRIKPEVLAFSFNGTSNSTALISGLSVLLQQEYQIMNGGDAPSALIKACLINSARDIGTPGPDFSSGFGKVDAFQSISTIKENNFILGQVTDKETKTYQIYVPSNAIDLKLTLVWTDPPALINSNIALINDLDLKLTAPDASDWNPWVLDHSPNIEAFTAPAKRAEDHLNNMEQITIPNPLEGNYAIEIKGFDVSNANQAFAIAYQWKKKDTFEWTYPTASDAISTGQNPGIRIQWDNTSVAGTGVLSISFDNGLNWQIIDGQVDIKANYYEWKPDELINSAAILKMKIENQEYLSDTFVIAMETNLTVAMDCDEIIELNWNENNGASSYKIYNFEQNKMLPFAETDQTFYALNKADFDTSLYAVQAVFSNGRLAQRSETIDYHTFGASCYFNSFYALNSNKETQPGIEIYLEIGSIYQLNRVEIYRIKNDQRELITSYATTTEKNYFYLDSKPAQGINRYQANIILNDGSEYYSEILEVPFLSEHPFLIFPNPTNNSGINILTKNFQEQCVTFKLYNAYGREILTRPIYSNNDYIDLHTISSGVYICKFESDNGLIETSVLIIQ